MSAQTSKLLDKPDPHIDSLLIAHIGGLVRIAPNELMVFFTGPQVLAGTHHRLGLFQKLSTILGSAKSKFKGNSDLGDQE